MMKQSLNHKNSERFEFLTVTDCLLRWVFPIKQAIGNMTLATHTFG